MRTALSWSDSSYFVVCSLRFLVAAPFAMKSAALGHWGRGEMLWRLPT